MHTIRAIIKLSVFGLCCITVIPIQILIVTLFQGGAIYHIPYIWHNIIRSAFGIKLTIHGTPATDRQTLYMSNHLSYLDISVLGSLIKASFVAKSEVETWPLFGLLSKLQKTAFIQRVRTKIAEQKSMLETRIKNGESLIIFPEGTSTHGISVVPFKSSLFSLAHNDETKNLWVQPITLRVITSNGKQPISLKDHEIYAWDRDDDTPLANHLWRFAKTTGAELEVIFHPPLKAHDFKNRKELAKACYDTVLKPIEENSPQIIKEEEYHEQRA